MIVFTRGLAPRREWKPEDHIRNEIKHSVLLLLLFLFFFFFFQLHAESLKPHKNTLLLGSVATRITWSFLMKGRINGNWTKALVSTRKLLCLQQAPQSWRCWGCLPGGLFLSLLLSRLLHPCSAAASVAACGWLFRAAGGRHKDI